MNRLYFEGLDLDEWAGWPDTLMRDAEAIVTEYVEGAQAAIAAAYPSEAAALAERVTHTIAVDGYQIAASVRNPHPLAWIYDHGTMTRHTEAGVDRGAEGPKHIFVPIAYEWAREEYLALSAMLQGFGFIVTGEIDDGDRIE
jgi:hypothetical protein